MKRISDKIRNNIINQYINGESAINLSQRFKISTKSIYNILKNIQYRHGTRKYFPNENVFDMYNKQSCYWAGFIAADGGIVKNNIEIGLKSGDYFHLKKFLNFIDAQYPITKRKDGTIRVSVGSKKMVQSLYKNFNIYANKTFSLKMSKMPKEFVSHYIRGYFDGDGSVYCDKSFLITFSITTGSKQQAYDIKHIIKEIYGIETHIYKHKNKFSIRKSGKEAAEIFNILYNDCDELYLNRKKLRFEKIVENRNHLIYERTYKRIFTKRNKEIQQLYKNMKVKQIAKKFNMTKSNCYLILKNMREFENAFK